MDISAATTGVTSVPIAPAPAPSGGGGLASATQSASQSIPEPGKGPAPIDSLFITVEPDGRDDVGFRDRLQQAIEGFFDAFQKRASEAAERALASIEEPLAQAEQSGESFAVRFRVAAVEAEFSDGSGDSFASVRQFGLEISVTQNGSTDAASTRVLDLQGQSFNLSQDQIGTGLSSGVFQTTAAAGLDGLSASDRERLETAQASLERVQTIQRRAAVFPRGDAEPLRAALEGGALTGAETTFRDALASIGRVNIQA